jgi:hypothetical protein
MVSATGRDGAGYRSEGLSAFALEDVPSHTFVHIRGGVADGARLDVRARRAATKAISRLWLCRDGETEPLRGDATGDDPAAYPTE